MAVPLTQPWLFCRQEAANSWIVWQHNHALHHTIIEDIPIHPLGLSITRSALHAHGDVGDTWYILCLFVLVLCSKGGLKMGIYQFTICFYRLQIAAGGARRKRARTFMRIWWEYPFIQSLCTQVFRAYRDIYLPLLWKGHQKWLSSPTFLTPWRTYKDPNHNCWTLEVDLSPHLLSGSRPWMIWWVWNARWRGRVIG